jgi:CBS domain-containing protein
MAELDIGSLVVMEHGDLVGMLTFREVIQAVVRNGGSVGSTLVRTVMDDAPLTCTPETEIDEVRRMMLQRHARYMPVLDQRTLMGVISFYDVAKAVVDSQDFENRMLKAYIRDWPVEDGRASLPPSPPARPAGLRAFRLRPLARRNPLQPGVEPRVFHFGGCPAAPSANSSASPTSARATARPSAA